LQTEKTLEKLHMELKEMKETLDVHDGEMGNLEGSEVYGFDRRGIG
jgi:hypothetical protein